MTVRTDLELFDSTVVALSLGEMKSLESEAIGLLTAKPVVGVSILTAGS